MRVSKSAFILEVSEKFGGIVFHFDGYIKYTGQEMKFRACLKWKSNGRLIGGLIEDPLFGNLLHYQ